MIEQARTRTDKGVVLVDACGHRSKVKSRRYSDRKAARGALERVWRGKSDTLGPRFAELEDQLWAMIPSESGDTPVPCEELQDLLRRFATTSLTGETKLDIAALFDEIDELFTR